MSKRHHAPSGPRLLNKKELGDIEAIGPKIRRQLEVHVTCMEARSSTKSELIQEWHEYLKKRTEIETEYAKSLEKLSDRTSERIGRLAKGTAGSKEHFPSCASTPIDFLQNVVNDGKNVATRHAGFAEEINLEILPRLDIVAKDVNMSNKRVREGLHAVHEEIKKAYSDMFEACKSYAAASAASDDSNQKLLKIQSSRSKGKNVDKDAKKEMKMLEGLVANKRKVIVCRNEYILTLSWYNQLCQAYFKRMSADLLQFLDFEFHSSISDIHRILEDMTEGVLSFHHRCVQSWRTNRRSLSAKTDLAAFQNANPFSFSVPNELPFLPYSVSEKHELHAVDGVYDTMTQQRDTLTNKSKTLSAQLQETFRTIMDLQENFFKGQKVLFGAGQSTASVDEDNAHAASSLKTKAPVTTTLATTVSSRREYHDTFCLAFNKLIELHTGLRKVYVMSDSLEDYLYGLSLEDVKRNTQSLVRDSIKVDEANENSVSHLDNYMLEHDNKIPPIITSCIRFVEEHGPDVEGVFRVPGIVNQIEEMKDLFDEDDDPLYGSNAEENKYDLHAVASLLKQYLRDLSEPVFPHTLFQRIVDTQSLKEKSEKVAELTEIMKELPMGRLIVTREIMRFLDNFSQHASATKMNANNLALVFGPTLLAPPPEMDAITLARHTTTINVVTHTMVENRDVIFGFTPEPTPAESADNLPARKPSLSRLELRKLEPLLFNKLGVTLLHAVMTDGAALERSSTRGSIVSLSAPHSGIPGETNSAHSIATAMSDSDFRPRSGICSSSLTEVSEDPQANASATTSLPSSRRESATAIRAATEGDESEEDRKPYNPVHRGSLHNPMMSAALVKSLAQSAVAMQLSSSSTSHSITETTEEEEPAPALATESKSPEATSPTSSLPVFSRNPPAEDSPVASVTAVSDELRRASAPSTSAADVSSPTSPSMPRASSPIPVRAGSISSPSPTRAVSLPSPGPVRAASLDVQGTQAAAASAKPTKQNVQAHHSYTARTAKELSFTKGDVLDVYAKSPDGNWWDCVINGKRGYIPASYVKAVQ